MDFLRGKFHLLLVILFTISIFNACNPIHRLSKKSSSGQTEITLPDNFVKLSSIAIPISISLDTLAKELRAQVPEYFEVDDSIACPKTPLPGENNCRIKGRIYVDSISLDGGGHQISLKTELRGVVTFFMDFEAEVTVFGQKVSRKESVSKNVFLQGDILVNSQPVMYHDWSISANFEGEVHLDEAYFVLGTRISIRNRLETQLQPLLDTELEKGETKIRNEYNLRNWFTPYWEKLGEPFQVMDSPLVFLHVLPEKISYNGLHIEDRIANLELGTDVNVITYLSKRPVEIKMDTIPNLQIGETQNPHLDLSLPVSITYHRLSEIFQNSMVGMEYEHDDETRFVIKDVSVNNQGRDVILGIDFESTRKGKVADGILYLKGTPLLEPGSQILRIVNLEFDVKTRNFLLSVAEWLLHSAFIDRIEQRAIYDLNPYLDQIKSEITPLLCDYTIDDQVRLSGEFNSVRVGQFYVTDDFILLLLEASGNTKVEVLGLKF